MEDFSMMSLYMLRYFYYRTSQEEYGVNVETLGDIESLWETLFSNEAANFYEIVGNLYEQKLLRKSIETPESAEDIDKKESLNSESKLYISPRGHELIEMLTRDSVLLEMIMETSFRDYEGRDYSELSSHELMVEGRQKEIFLDLLNYIEYLCEKEDTLRLLAIHQGQEELFRTKFGEHSSASAQLLEGVKCSLRYSGIIYDSDVSEKLYYIERMMNN